MEHKYDVFISYSRKDYVDENENVLPDSPVNAILNFLDKNKISYWFDKKGLYKGAEFVEVISDAIVESKMMIFLSTTNSNESIYTAGEIFEAIENNKLIIPIKVDDSKYNKKFRLLVNPLDYVDYKKADALSDLLKTIECEKAKIAEQEREAAKKAEELKKREWRKAVKIEILDQAEELNKLKETRKALLDSIYKKMRTIDITQKQCPICGAKTEIEAEYCKICGWFFPALSNIEGIGVEADKSAIILARSRWESKSSFDGKNGHSLKLENVNKIFNCLKKYKKRYWLHIISIVANIFLIVLIFIFGIVYLRYFRMVDFLFWGLIQVCLLINIVGITQLLKGKKTGVLILLFNSIILYNPLEIKLSLSSPYFIICITIYLLFILLLYLIHKSDKVSVLSWTKMNNISLKRPLWRTLLLVIIFLIHLFVMMSIILYLI